MKTFPTRAFFPLALALLLSGTPACAAMIGFTLNATDNDDPSEFGLVIVQPIAPLFGVVDFSAQIEGMLTDASGDGVAANLAPSYLSIFGFLLNDIEIFSDPLGGVSSSFGPLLYGGTYDCGLAGCSNMSTRVNFLGSGGGDQYSFTASFQVTEASVPEPGTIGLILLALAGLGAVRWLRSPH